MQPIYTRIKYDIKYEMIGATHKLTPYLTISQTPESIVYRKTIPIGMDEYYSSPNNEDLLDVMVEQLSQGIAEKFRPSLKLLTSQDFMNREKVYELKLNLVLPEEKLLYKSKETMLKEMVEDGYRKYERYKSKYILTEQELIDTKECLLDYTKMEKSVWSRLKFLFKGKV